MRKSRVPQLIIPKSVTVEVTQETKITANITLVGIEGKVATVAFNGREHSLLIGDTLRIEIGV